jgi:hypothetical protein
MAVPTAMQRRRGRTRWRKVFTMYGLGGKQFFSQTIRGFPEDYQRLMERGSDIEGFNAGTAYFTTDCTDFLG